MVPNYNLISNQNQNLLKIHKTLTAPLPVALIVVLAMLFTSLHCSDLLSVSVLCPHINRVHPVIMLMLVVLVLVLVVA